VTVFSPFLRGEGGVMAVPCSAWTPDEGQQRVRMMDMRGHQPWKANRAQALRSTQPACDDILWRALRDRRLGGFKFVRQMPIGPYFADFACRGCRVIVEVDGATHSTEDEMRADRERGAYLAQSGYRLLRVNNTEVTQNLDGVLHSILTLLQKSGERRLGVRCCPSPALRGPSPRKDGERTRQALTETVHAN
jgi:very-short-patch-repair endonuclease